MTDAYEVAMKADEIARKAFDDAQGVLLTSINTVGEPWATAAAVNAVGKVLLAQIAGDRSATAARTLFDDAMLTALRKLVDAVENLTEQIVNEMNRAQS